MASQATCPVTIIILPANKGPVRTIQCQAVVYRRRQLDKWYYLMQFSKFHLRLHLRDDGRGFSARLAERNYELIFPELNLQ